MKQLAIIHYHLNRGGVTRVIANQLTALERAVAERGDAPWQVLLLYGGRDQGWPAEMEQRAGALSIRRVALPDLDYSAPNAAHPDRLAEQLADVLTQQGFTKESALLHVHNHSLGKNLALPPALCQLARSGYRLLLQIHDFAEDFRPTNYRDLLRLGGEQPVRGLASLLYPQAHHIHYAVLNDRDRAILEAAGVAPARLHLLPNPVLPVGPLPEKAAARQKLAQQFGIEPQRRYALYPVRGIRRKNIGELLLWSLLPDGKTTFAVTLPPLNPAEQPTYQHWKELAERWRLPCVFEVGADGALGFAENLATADLLLTTSLAEGFGMVFLETWLTGRPLAGRDLPEITRDFRAHGLALDTLASRIQVPVDWVGHQAFCTMVETSYRNVLDAYERPVPESRWLERNIERKIEAGQVDFGDLDVALQSRVLERLAHDTNARQQLADHNPTMLETLSNNTALLDETVAENANIVDQHYSVDASGQRLVDLYTSVFECSASRTIKPPENADAILDAFLSLDRFRPLRIPQ